jgi:SAM-dependent methyltransferase
LNVPRLLSPGWVHNAVMPGRSIDEQRLAFGRVAELYDRARPSYPSEAIDELVAFAGLRPGARVLEVGAGTGKATRMLADRGFAVQALEPDAAMAAVARRTCGGYLLVEIVQTSFEAWQPGERVHAVVCAQAWHWITPEVRYVRAGEALLPRGTLASIWTFPCWATTPLRDRLRDAYSESVPDLAPDFPMHPASEPTNLAGDWQAEIDSSKDFADPRVREHQWSCSHATADYVALLQTHQDHILLEPEKRQRLMAAVSLVIDQAGGAINIDYITRLCLAHRL